MIIPAKGFWIEGTNKYTDLPKSISASPDTTLPDYDACELEHYDHQATWFRTYFADQDYLTICGNSVDNPILITIIEEMPNASLKEVDSEDDSHSDQDTQYRVIMRKTTVSREREGWFMGWLSCHAMPFRLFVLYTIFVAAGCSNACFKCSFESRVVCCKYGLG